LPREKLLSIEAGAKENVTYLNRSATLSHIIQIQQYLAVNDYSVPQSNQSSMKNASAPSTASVKFYSQLGSAFEPNY
jgi:hypothetical protein